MSCPVSGSILHRPSWMILIDACKRLGRYRVKRPSRVTASSITAADLQKAQRT